MELPKQPLAQPMEVAKPSPPQELLPRQTFPTHVAFASVAFPVQAVFGRFALVFPSPFGLSSLSRRESGLGSRRKPVVLFCLFQLSAARGRDSRSVTQHREELPGRSSWIFRFRPTFSPFHLTLSFFRPPLSLFRVAADVSVKRVITDSCVTDARRVVDHGLVTHGIVFETTTLDWSALWPTALLKVPSPLVKSAKAPTAVLSSPVVLLNSAPAPTAVFSGPLLTRSVAPPTAVQKLPSVRLRTA